MLRFLLCRTLVLEATTHIYSVAVSVCSSVSWVAPLPPPVFPPPPSSLSLAACSVSPLSTVLCCQRQQPQFSFCCVSHFVCVCVFRGCAINFFHPSPVLCVLLLPPFRSTASSSALLRLPPSAFCRTNFTLTDFATVAIAK